MSGQIIVPEESDLFRSLASAATTRKMVFLAGIPGVGKSLYVQQLVLLAQAAGRRVHLFQYDVTRMAFEHHPIGLEKYPEIDGVTQPIMRKAVGVWARRGVEEWAKQFSGDEHMLIGEIPLIGNRLIELVQVGEDTAEPLLAGDQTLIMIPVPSKRIREKIVQMRTASINNPRNQKETKDAQINVLRMVWEEAHHLAVNLNLANPLDGTNADIPYEPSVYAAVYEYLCRHRHVESLHVDLDLNPPGSVYDLGPIESERRASPAEVEAIIDELETSYTLEEIEEMVGNWFD